MLTLMLGTVIATLICGVFWHNQPARGENRKVGASTRRG